jgi:hypothetical protein
MPIVVLHQSFKPERLKMAERDGSGMLGILVGAMLVILIGAAAFVWHEKQQDDDATLVIKLPGAD